MHLYNHLIASLQKFETESSKRNPILSDIVIRNYLNQTAQGILNNALENKNSATEPAIKIQILQFSNPINLNLWQN